MTEPTKDTPRSVICFKVCGTCVVLLIPALVGWLIARGMEADENAIAMLFAVWTVLIAVAGFTLLIGIIAAIWEN